MGTLAQHRRVKLLRILARAALRLCGWRLLDVPRPPRAVIVGYPHTSNWDFVWAIPGLVALGIQPRWAGKDSLFRGLGGLFMRLLGGIPVNRREHTGFVGRMVEEFARHDHFLLVIAAEGTRARTEGWKSGFLRIAKAAEVPLIVATIDYGRRELGLLGTLSVSGDDDADMASIAALLAGRRGRRPENAGPIRLLK